MGVSWLRHLVVLAAAAAAGLLPAAAAAATPAAHAAPTPIPMTIADTWVWKNPLPSGTTLTHASFPTARDGWAISTSRIYATNDSGRHWWLQSRMTGKQFNGIDFRSLNRGWVVGDDGLIRRTTDGGAHWTTQASGTTSDLNDVFFLTAQRGWACGDGGVLLKTGDGGATWSPQDSTVTSALYAVGFYDALRGWAAGSAADVLHTTDGGAHWQAQTCGGSGYADLAVVSARRAWLAGSGSVWATTDGGAGWIAQDPALGHAPSGVEFADALDGWAFSKGGGIAATTDGGAHWTPQTLYPGTLPYDVEFPTPTRGYIVGSAYLGAAVSMTTDAGANWWRRERMVTSLGLLDVAVGGTGVVHAVGEATAMTHTTDDGATWENWWSAPNTQLRAVAAFGTSRAWAVGVRQADNLGCVVTTTDGGRYWTEQLGDLDFFPWAVAAVGEQRIYVGGQKGNIWATTDGGEQWAHQATGTVEWVSDLDFVDAAHGWAAAGDSVLRTTDHGAHWLIASLPATFTGSVGGVAFADFTHGWASGDGGQIVATTDGGVSWAEQDTPVSVHLRDIDCVSPQRAWAVGEQGTIVRTVNGGDSWVVQDSDTDLNLTGVACRPSGAVWVVGAGGTILARNATVKPHIVRLAPTAVRRGGTLTIHGWGFGAARGASGVKVGPREVTTFVSWSNMRIKIKVPAVPSGRRWVKVFVDGNVSNLRRVRVR